MDIRIGMKNLITILKYLVFLGVVILLVIIACKYERVPEGMVEVRKTWLDSLQAVAESKPDSVIVETVDTVNYPVPVPVEVKVPVYITQDTTEYLDTLQTDYFALYLRDRYYNNALQQRSFTYDVYIPEKTITIYEKIPMPYEVTVSQPRFYGGVQAGNLFSADISYRAKNNFYGIGIGYYGKTFVYLRYQFGIF